MARDVRLLRAQLMSCGKANHTTMLIPTADRVTSAYHGVYSDPLNNSFHAIFAALLLLVLVLSSCAGLQRTSLDTWEKREFKELGISIEIPSKAMFVEIGIAPVKHKGSGYRSLTFYLHPVYSKHMLSEPIYLISCWLYRMSADNYDLFTQQKHDLSFDWEFKDHYKEFYPSVTNYVAKYYNADGFCYRKDIKCSNGDVLLMTVMYGPLIDNKDNEPTDIEAIKRIINSVTVLDDKGNAEPGVRPE